MILFKYILSYTNKQTNNTELSNMSPTPQEYQAILESNHQPNISTQENSPNLVIRNILLNHLEFEEIDLENGILDSIINNLILLVTPSISNT